MAVFGAFALAGCAVEVPSRGAVAEAGVGVSPGEDGSVPPALRDAGTTVGQPSPGDAGGAAQDAAAGCALGGRYAVMVEFDVAWVGTQFAGILPIISPGEGKLSFGVIGEFHEAGGGVDFEFRNCQASVPEFISTLPQERYQVRFSNMVWDSPSMPNFRGQVTTCSEPGCALRSTPIDALIGSALSDPAADWPTSAARGQWPDHDGDGRRGVNAFMLGPSTGGNTAYPPLDLLGFRRVQKLDLGMRVRLTLSGRRESCDTIAGVIEDGAIDTRGLDCIATSRPMACEPAELQFLDDNLPAWTVRQGTFRGMKVDDGDGCARVRELTGFGQSGAP